MTNSLRLFFIITFLHAGISNSSIIISYRKEVESLILTCELSGHENLTQVNWEIQWPNHTKVGTFHPVYGTYVPPEYSDRVSIEGRHLSSSVSLSLEKTPLADIGQICCVFITFPSGHLMQCTTISDNDGVNANNRMTEAKQAGRDLGLFGQLGAMTVGCILSLFFFIAPVYLCHKCFCTRRKQFRVQQAHYTDPSTPSETYTENAQEVRHPAPSSGFDPTKLYAKIKNDLYYGRLWKAYQGRARVSTQGSPPGSKIYYRLGEHPQPQTDEVDRPKSPEVTMTDSNN
ncbi:uncharacterized protein LOC143475390 [Brachyhypopomus gauderio]|uniref:uncharacterized protein LOC143475390 n=1 Tax=Brachyhypopomus gauderio TaxID=698409 RepID=UPI0040412F65